MRRYETILILKPDSAEAAVSTLVKKIEKILSGKPGEVFKKDDWGLRKLAYEIGKERKGRYLLWYYAQTPEAIRALERLLKFDETLLRSMTVVVGDGIEAKIAQKMKKVAAQEAAQAADAAGAEEGGEGRRKGPARRRGGHYFADDSSTVDYKDVNTLANFVSERGRIMPRRMSGMNAFQQRALATAVKRARHLALLSYTEPTYPAPAEETVTP